MRRTVIALCLLGLCLSGAWSAHALVRRDYVRAELADGHTALSVAANWTRPWSYAVAAGAVSRDSTGPLVLNELQADNKTTLADPNGDYDDWVELYNRGSEPVDLSDYFLSDDPAEPQRFALPDVSLAPGSFTLIWCDSDGKQGPDHAPFKLNKDGDALYLSSATATVDEVTFGLQTTDHSHGRSPDGGATWLDCAASSPRAANACGGSVPTPSPTASPTPDVPPTVGPPLTVHLFLPWSGRSR
jgi:hypothetical protein